MDFQMYHTREHTSTPAINNSSSFLDSPLNDTTHISNDTATAPHHHLRDTVECSHSPLDNQTTHINHVTVWTTPYQIREAVSGISHSSDLKSKSDFEISKSYHFDQQHFDSISCRSTESWRSWMTWNTWSSWTAVPLGRGSIDCTTRNGGRRSIDCTVDLKHVQSQSSRRDHWHLKHVQSRSSRRHQCHVERLMQRRCPPSPTSRVSPPGTPRRRASRIA